MLANNIQWPQQMANVRPYYVFLYNILMEIAYVLICWQSWQTFLNAKKLANIPPPLKSGGIQMSKIPKSETLNTSIIWLPQH